MSEEASQVPKELLESVRDAVGRKVKLSLRKRVKLEIKGDKMENRVLTLHLVFMKAHGTLILIHRSLIARLMHRCPYQMLPTLHLFDIPAERGDPSTVVEQLQGTFLVGLWRFSSSLVRGVFINLSVFK
ncbi:uncharacterized protein [Nothobranchius furzeri]|uniref:uncharacterized protein n=1 Tax=Nothobranchius furzeri TaxID=105023 RepID=UPI003904CFE6